jgi:arginine decarboxylase
MKIHVSSAVGQGSTELATFDNALSGLGVGDQNLIHLSSVIPLNATIKREAINFNGTRQGDRVYCVYAEKRTDTKGLSVAAGLGWLTTTEQPNWGLFVEHTGHTEEEVKKQIEASLASMAGYRSQYAWSRPQMEIVSTTCKSEPVCAMALAVYQMVPWQQSQK